MIFTHGRIRSLDKTSRNTVRRLSVVPEAWIMQCWCWNWPQGLTHNNQRDLPHVYPRRLLHFALVGGRMAGWQRGDDQGRVTKGGVTCSKVQPLDELGVAMDILPPPGIREELKEKVWCRKTSWFKTMLYGWDHIVDVYGFESGPGPLLHASFSPPFVSCLPWTVLSTQKN